MKKSAVYFVLIVWFDIVSIVVADGSIIEIRGIIAFLIFALPIVLNVISVRKYNKTFQKIILSVMMCVYLFI